MNLFRLNTHRGLSLKTHQSKATNVRNIFNFANVVTKFCHGSSESTWVPVYLYRYRYNEKQG
jgi:hypothetical protein